MSSTFPTSIATKNWESLFQRTGRRSFVDDVVDETIGRDDSEARESVRCFHRCSLAPIEPLPWESCFEHDDDDDAFSLDKRPRSYEKKRRQCEFRLVEPRFTSAGNQLLTESAARFVKHVKLQQRRSATSCLQRSMSAQVFSQDVNQLRAVTQYNAKLHMYLKRDRVYCDILPGLRPALEKTLQSHRTDHERPARKHVQQVDEAPTLIPGALVDKILSDRAEKQQAKVAAPKSPQPETPARRTNIWDLKSLAMFKLFILERNSTLTLEMKEYLEERHCALCVCSQVSQAIQLLSSHCKLESSRRVIVVVGMEFCPFIKTIRTMTRFSSVSTLLLLEWDTIEADITQGLENGVDHVVLRSEFLAKDAPASSVLSILSQCSMFRSISLQRMDPPELFKWNLNRMSSEQLQFLVDQSDPDQALAFFASVRDQSIKQIRPALPSDHVHSGDSLNNSSLVRALERYKDKDIF